MSVMIVIVAVLGVLGLLVLIMMITGAKRVERPPFIPGPFPPEVAAFIRANPRNKIGAIKAYRERTGCGLAEAKEQVEAWIDANPAGENQGPIITRQ